MTPFFLLLWAWTWNDVNATSFARVKVVKGAQLEICLRVMQSSVKS